MAQPLAAIAARELRSREKGGDGGGAPVTPFLGTAEPCRNMFHKMPIVFYLTIKEEVTMQDINIYSTIDDWEDEKPYAVLKGTVEELKDTYIKIRDENGLTQILVLNKLFAVVY